MESKFPFAFLIAILSYTLILIIEKLAFDTHKWLEIHVHPDLHHHEHKKSVKQEASTFLSFFRMNFPVVKDLFIKFQSMKKKKTMIVAEKKEKKR